MSLQTYRYTGPVSGAALNWNGEILDVRLHPGKPVQLPEQHEYAQTLLGLGYLHPLAKNKPGSNKGRNHDG